MHPAMLRLKLEQETTKANDIVVVPVGLFKMVLDHLSIEASSAWRAIPRGYKIDHDDMVLIRKPNAKGGYHVDLAYSSKGAGWRLAQSGASGIQGYREWCPIPR